MKRSLSVMVSVLAAVVMTGCQGAAHHANAVDQGNGGDRLSAGKVELSIHKGMPQSEVLAALGSPNIVSTDANSCQVWTWDRMSTSRVTSAEGGGVFLLLGGVSGGASASSTSQRTMTLIIYFDNAKLVREVAYHMSSF